MSTHIRYFDKEIYKIIHDESTFLIDSVNILVPFSWQTDLVQYSGCKNEHKVLTALHCN